MLVSTAIRFRLRREKNSLVPILKKSNDRCHFFNPSEMSTFVVS